MTTPPTILTLTGNLLAEHTMDFDHWAPGQTQRSSAVSFQVGGKGINVSRMLRRLGDRTEALCFPGGAAGVECTDWLKAQGLPFRAFENAAETRRGFVVRSRGAPETTFLGADVPPEAAALTGCAAYLDSVPPGSVLAVCGSFPGADRPQFDVLLAAIRRWQSHGPVVVDAHGPALARLSALPLNLVKVNATEFASVAAARGNLPVRNWVISDGAKPLRYFAEDGTGGSLNPPRVTEVSATGSGDVLLACLLHAWLLQGRPLREAIDFALPYAAANAAHPGVAEFPLPRDGT